MFNFATAITAILGGIVGYLASSIMQTSIIYLLPFAAGNFIYIAAADLVPEIKHQVSLRRSILHFGVFVIGIAIMLTVKFIH
jgi:zinc and cadmium transporter